MVTTPWRQTSPSGLDIEKLRQDVEDSATGCGLHHVHVWEVRPGRMLLTAHVRMPLMPLVEIERRLQTIHDRLETHWKVKHATLEPELTGCGSQALLGAGSACSE